MERKEKFEQNEFYHIYNRGAEKRVTFQNISDYKRFIALLYLANSKKTIEFRNCFKKKNLLEEIFKQDRGEQLVAIGAYCLMPNHFHLLLTPLTDNGISKFMQKLQTAYTMYFNIKNERVGALFQGVFKSRHIDKDRYLRWLYSYIHLNPAKLKNKDWKIQPKSFLNQLEKFIIEYPYSSLQEYISSDYKIINPRHFPVNEKEIRDYGELLDDFSENKENY